MSAVKAWDNHTWAEVIGTIQIAQYSEHSQDFLSTDSKPFDKQIAMLSDHIQRQQSGILLKTTKTFGTLYLTYFD